MASPNNIAIEPNAYWQNFLQEIAVQEIIFDPVLQECARLLKFRSVSNMNDDLFRADMIIFE